MSTAEVNDRRVSLFSDTAEAQGETRGTGILPSQGIRALLEQGRVSAVPSIPEEQVQPASLDLRLGEMAHRVQASFLPGRFATVEERIKQLRMTRIDLTKA